MKRLLRYLKNYRIQCILAPLFKMLEASFELFVPLVIADLVDRITVYSGNGDISFVGRYFFLLILLGMVGLISACTAQYFAAKAATGFAKELRSDLFSSLLKLDFAHIDSLGTSTMITRMTADVNTAQNGVNMFLRLFLRSPFIVAGAVFMAFRINAHSGALILGVVLILSVVVVLTMRYNIPMLKRVQKALDGILRLTRENLSGARVIRAFTASGRRQAEFESVNSDLTALQVRAGYVSGLLSPLTFVIVNMGIVALIALGNIQVTEGDLTTGQVVALYNYMSQILLELIKFANLIVSINRALASAGRISEVFAVSESASEEESSGTGDRNKINSISSGSVEFNHVSLQYIEGADEALSDISFTADAGETIGIIGGTGSGKTSLINMIPGFYKATSGTVSIGGNDVNSIDDRVLRRMVGVVPQKAVLFRGTIAENLRWGNKDATDEELYEAVELAMASDVVKAKGGLDAMLEQGGRNLSGGQRQRLTIARALVGRPGILILDDSSSALDNLTDRGLRENIKSLDYSPTVFIVSQRTASVKDSDKIIVLEDGEMVGIGTHNELLGSCNVYREIYESQYGSVDTNGEGA